MKIFNTPAQAKQLREIEAAAMSPIIQQIKNTNGTMQTKPRSDAPTKEKREEEETLCQISKKKKATKATKKTAKKI